MSKKIFGRLPSGERLARIKTSPNYREGSFQNIEPTSLMSDNVSIFKLIKDYSDKPKTVNPPSELPHIKTDLHQLDKEKDLIIWFGHSSYIISLQGFTILVDPVLSGHASPVKFFGKPFPGADNYKLKDFPPIDLLILTHDHYDHLDYKTVSELHKTVKQIITPLGVGSHLEYWGVENGKITELDWWQSSVLNNGFEITSTPSRHFSGRGLTRAKTLWCSFVLNTGKWKLFLGGDSGYDKQFKIIGDKFDGFDLAILECGQYGKDWPLIHMKPEETVLAATELRASVLLPVHWGKFVLSNHPWDEPINRLSAEATAKNQKFITPLIGEPYTIGEDFNSKEWWKL